MRITARVTDLWNDGQGWSENAAWAKQVELDLPENASDIAIARAIKKALGVQGMRKDCWAGDEWSWRSGCIGAYAWID